MRLSIIFFMIIVFCTADNAQQIEVNPMLGFSKGGAAYSLSDKKIYLSWEDRETTEKFIHELGHHIWFYGDVDTLAFIESVKEFGWSWTTIREQFAYYHCDYWIGLRWNPEADSIFYKFYNKQPKWKPKGVTNE